MKPRIDTLRRQLRDLKSLHDGDTLSTDAYEQARGPLERELVDLVTGASAASPGVPSRLAAGLVMGVLVLAVGGYAITGSPGRAGWPAGGSQPPTVAAGDAAPPITEQQVAEVIDRIEQRLKDKPDDPAGWALLARAYSAMGRQSDAIPAYRKALALAGNDAMLMADLADALATQNSGAFSDEALQLVGQALAIEPGNFKALALAGSAAFDQRDYATAARHWEQVALVLPPDSPMLSQVRASIAQARQLGGLPEAPAAPRPLAAPSATQPMAAAVAPGPMAAASPAPSVAAAARATSVSGRVSLAPELAARAAPGDTVFILARAAQGPRMPLAVLRKQVKDLPLDFTLDDSMAMAPTAKISDHPSIVVSARISKSGDALPKAGDLGGQSTPVAPGASGVVVRISEVVSP